MAGKITVPMYTTCESNFIVLFFKFRKYEKTPIIDSSITQTSELILLTLSGEVLILSWFSCAAIKCYQMIKR